MVHRGILANSLMTNSGPESVIFKALTNQINHHVFIFLAKYACKITPLLSQQGLKFLAFVTEKGQHHQMLQFCPEILQGCKAKHQAP